MKKKLILIIALLSLTLTGCSKKKEATDSIEFYLTSTSEGQTVVYRNVYTYNDEDVVSGDYFVQYSGLTETPTNNLIFTDYRTLQSSLEAVKNVEVTIETSEDGYIYNEVWDYYKIDIDEVITIDSRQEYFIEDGKYSIQKITEYYEVRGFSKNVEKIEK